MYKEGATIDVTLDDWEIMHTLRFPPTGEPPRGAESRGKPVGLQTQQ